MAKRGADRQMTKGGPGEEEDSDVQPDGTWSEAPAEKLAQRTFVKVKRKGSDLASSGTILPAGGGGGGEEEKKEEKKVVAKESPPKEKKTKKEEAKEEKKEDKKEEKKELAGAPAPMQNAFAKFMLQPGQWECPHCLVKNEKDVSKCRACEIARDAPAGATPSSIPQATAASAGNSSASAFAAAASPAAASPFSFGVPATSSASSASSSAVSPLTSSPSFSFGASTSFSGSNFTFGGAFGASAASSVGGVTFGSVAAPEAGSGFGEAAGTLKFETNNRLTGDATVSEVFKDKKAESSGEESDTVVHKVNCKVYSLQTAPEKKGDGKEETKGEGAAPTPAAPKFVECGTGELHVNTFVAEGKTKARLVLRAAQTQRLVLNAPIFSEMTHSVDDKYVKLISTGLKGELVSYALRLKNKTESTELDAQITSIIDKIKAK